MSKHQNTKIYVYVSSWACTAVHSHCSHTNHCNKASSHHIFRMLPHTSPKCTHHVKWFSTGCVLPCPVPQLVPLPATWCVCLILTSKLLEVWLLTAHHASPAMAMTRPSAYNKSALWVWACTLLTCLPHLLWLQLRWILYLPIHCRMLAVTISLLVPEPTNVVCVVVMEHLAHKLEIRFHFKIWRTVSSRWITVCNTVSCNVVVASMHWILACTVWLSPTCVVS